MSGAPHPEGTWAAAAPGEVPRPAEPPPGGAILSVLCRDVESAEGVTEAMATLGVPAESLSVIARGPQVEKRLIKDPEMNANLRVFEGAEPKLSGLVERFAKETKRLLEGCWAIGPLFRQVSAKTLGAQGVESLTRALLQAGLEIKEAATLESILKSRGGIWIGVRGPRLDMERIRAEVRERPGVIARVLPIKG